MNCCALTASAQRLELSRIAAWMRASRCLAQNRSAGPELDSGPSPATRQREHRALRLQAGNRRTQLGHGSGADRGRQLLEGDRSERLEMAPCCRHECVVTRARDRLRRPVPKSVVGIEACYARQSGGKLAALGGHPPRAGGGKFHAHGPARARERVHPVVPFRPPWGKHERAEQVVQLLGIPQFGLCLFGDPRHDTRVERSKIACLQRQDTPRRDGARPPLFERGVIEEGIGTPVQDLLGQDRGRHSVDAQRPHVARPDSGEHVGQALEVHRLAAAVVEGLAHDGVIGDRDRPRNVLLACGKGREHGGHEVVRLHAPDGGRDPSAPAVAR